MRYRAKRCRLNEILEVNRWSQRELATFTGVPKSSISNYIRNDHTMTLETAKTIAEAIGCTVEDLYEWEKES